MCRSIKTLRPPFTDNVSDSCAPPRCNMSARFPVFERLQLTTRRRSTVPVDEIASATSELLGELQVRDAEQFGVR